MIRLVIADDHPIVRAGLAAMLGAEEDLDIVVAAATPEEAIDAARDLGPDLVLMDLQFGARSALTGADATARIRALPAPPYVLVLTNYDTDADILGAVEAGASGYLLKDAPPEELVAAIRAAAHGESALAPGVAARLLQRLRSPQAALSARELDVLTAASGGLSNQEIAERLFISETTVKTHLGHVFSKLGVSSRTAAISAAREQGILR